MKIYLGIDNNDELIYLEWDKIDNKQRNTFSLCGGSYNEPKTETQGEENARETLKDSSYWDDLGMLDKNSFLTNFINFDEVAEHVLNTDGWENTNGEYNHFGEYNDEEIYLNYSSGGQHQVKIKDFKELWINKKDLEEVYKLWDNFHLKPLKEEYIKIMDSFFEKYKNLCSDQEVLIKYLKAINF